MGIIIGGTITPGSGLDSPLLHAGAPVNGVLGTGTFAGIVPKGGLLNDITNGILYQNTGTQASPVWSKVGAET
jgi:hypothetical protein